MPTLSEEILSRLKKLFPEGATLHEPLFEGNEWLYVKECIDTQWVSSVGKFVDRFEQDLAIFTRAKCAVAIVNGTSALHLALMLGGVKREDEVLVPTMTFVATANAISYCGATPHFIDISKDTLGIDPYKLNDYLAEIAEIRNDGLTWNKNTGKPIIACVPMHTFGHPVDMDNLIKVCQKWNITIIEDAAESLGSYYKNTHTGLFGKLGILSLNGNKIITSGGGGAIITNDEKLAMLAKHLSTTAKLSHTWEFIHDRIGYNYRLPNINAALACAQLEKLPLYLKRKRHLAEKYQKIFQDLEGISIFSEPDNCSSNYWLNLLILDKENINQQEEILIQTNANKIMTRPVWKLLSNLTIYQHCPSMELEVSKEMESRIICLPSSVKLSE